MYRAITVGSVEFRERCEPCPRIPRRPLNLSIGDLKSVRATQSALTVHADVHFHAEIPLLAFARLMHLRVTHRRDRSDTFLMISPVPLG